MLALGAGAARQVQVVLHPACWWLRKNIAQVLHPVEVVPEPRLVVGVVKVFSCFAFFSFSSLSSWRSRPVLVLAQSAARLSSATGTALLRFAVSCLVLVSAGLCIFEMLASDCFAFLLMVVIRSCCGTSPAIESWDHCARRACCLLLVGGCAASVRSLLVLLLRKPCSGSMKAFKNALYLLCFSLLFVGIAAKVPPILTCASG